MPGQSVLQRQLPRLAPVRCHWHFLLLCITNQFTAAARLFVRFHNLANMKFNAIKSNVELPVFGFLTATCTRNLNEWTPGTVFLQFFVFCFFYIQSAVLKRWCFLLLATQSCLDATIKQQEDKVQLFVYLLHAGGWLAGLHRADIQGEHTQVQQLWSCNLDSTERELGSTPHQSLSASSLSYLRTHALRQIYSNYF